MTEEDKNLLLKDLCARLLYGVKILTNESRIICELLRCGKYDDGNDYFIATKIGFALKTDEFKPYLRPMSSMTKEERNEFDEYTFEVISFFGQAVEAGQLTDWLNAHHFDYRGLIERGLALEAPEEMYNNLIRNYAL